MNLTAQEVITEIEEHTLTIERDPLLSQKVKNQQIIALESALLRVRLADEKRGK